MPIIIDRMPIVTLKTVYDVRAIFKVPGHELTTVLYRDSLLSEIIENSVESICHSTEEKALVRGLFSRGYTSLWLEAQKMRKGAIIPPLDIDSKKAAREQMDELLEKTEPADRIATYNKELYKLITGQTRSIGGRFNNPTLDDMVELTAETIYRAIEFRIDAVRAMDLAVGNVYSILIGKEPKLHPQLVEHTLPLSQRLAVPSRLAR